MDHRLRQGRRLLFYSLCLTYIVTGILMILPGATLLLFAAHTHVTLDIAGWIFTASSLGFTLSVMCAGAISTRFSPKNMIITGIAITGLLSLLSPLTHSFMILLIAQFIMGIGFGFIDVSINVIVTMQFEDALGETMNNLHSAFGIGALVGPLLLALSLQLLHEAAWAFGIGGILGFITILLLLRQPIATIARQGEAKEVRTATTSRKVLMQTVLWIMALQMFLYIAAEVGFGDWIVTAVSQSAATTLVVAAPAATMFWIGLTSGRLLSAQLLRHSVLSEVQVLYLSFIGGGIGALIVALFSGNLWVSFGGSLLTGLFFGPIFPGIMTIASRRFVHALGVVSSVMFFSAGASGLIFPVLVGVLIAHIGVGWGITVPALASILITIPFYLAERQQRNLMPIEETLAPPITEPLRS